MECKDCANVKGCWMEKDPKKCGCFEKYEDSDRFVACDRMMRSNRGSSIADDKPNKSGIPPFWKWIKKQCPRCKRFTMREDVETGVRACNNCGYVV